MNRARVIAIFAAVAASAAACNAIIGLDSIHVCDGGECADVIVEGASDVATTGDASDGGCQTSPDLFDAAPACSPDASWANSTAFVLKTDINSPTAEQVGGFIGPDGRELYFARRELDASAGPANGFQIFVAKNNGTDFANPTIVPNVNAPVPEGGIPPGDYMPTVSPDGLTLYFDSYRAGGGAFTSTRPTRCDPWSAAQSFTGLAAYGGYRAYPIFGALYFTAPGPNGDVEALYRAPVDTGGALGSGTLFVELNSTSKDFDPVVTPDERTIYFSSDRNGFYAFQIFMATRANATDAFGAPVPLPSNINSTGANIPRYVTPDNCTLYYASTGADPFAPYQMYRVTRGK